VHFACHGAASFFDPAFTAALSLAHEQPLGIQELLEIPDFAPRLVVASACETGVIQGYSTADESLTLASLFVGAGAAGVVATLWAVDDYATALLMSRFYENLIAGDLAAMPAAALREAQLWLRELSAEEEVEYVSTRAILRTHKAGRGGPGSESELAESDYKPFRDPAVWAPFTFTGA
jgi:CHAT domain-containing protein